MARATRSSIRQEPESVDLSPASDTPTPMAGKSSRGRPSRASTATTSTVPTPATSSAASSVSDYATPLTSNLATPVDASRASSVKRFNRIEVQLPAAKPPADSQRALRQSIYAMGSKRKRVIDDSEDDDGDYDSPDAKLARKLQDEEDALASPMASVSSLGRRGARQNTRGGRASASALAANPSKDSYDDDEDEVMFLRKKPLNRQGKNKTSATKPIVIADSDEDSGGNFESSALDSESVSEPPQPRVRTRGSAKAKATNSKAAQSSTTGGEPPRFRASEDIADSEDDEDFVIEDEDDFSAASHSTTARPRPAPRINLVDEDDEDVEDDTPANVAAIVHRAVEGRRAYRSYRSNKRVKQDRQRLEKVHPELASMWDELKNMPILKAGKAAQPKSITRQLKPFQLEGLAWMKEMEKTQWKGGLLGDEMGLGKTIQAVSLIMSDYPQKQPSLVLVPPVALMQWMTEIESYTDGTLKTLVFHVTNSKSKNLTVKELKQYNVIIMSYNSLESMFRKQEKGFKRKDGLYKEKSIIHQTQFHRVILDEAHSIKTRSTMTAKACFALKVNYRWCLTGTPLQNRIGEFFSLVRFLNVRPFACYLCKHCACNSLEWSMDDDNRCKGCRHNAMQHISVFNQELLNPILKYGNHGPGHEAFQKLRIMTDRIMLRRLKKDHTDSMELPVKEVFVDRQFFGEEENDFANSIMTNSQRKFDTYVASRVMLNNYANIFGLIMQMRQVADHPDLILKKDNEGGQNVLVCSICDEPAEEAIKSRCKHDFCRTCARSYLNSTEGGEDPDCPRCHIPLSIDLDQAEIEQDESLVRKSSIINRIKMENWTSSSKIELLVHELHKLRSDNATHKSIIFSQFTTMLQLIEWRLRRAGITTVMLDGSMTPAQRQASIQHFMKNVDVECFLVSLKAGGVALNLTEASRVFIVDPWWNPAAEWQSADRCHRIGQTRPCTITRLCIEDSVESRMVLLQEKKTNMINSTINSDDAAMDSLSPEDLQFLFRGS